MKTWTWDGKTYRDVTPCCKMPLFMEMCCMTHSEGRCSGCGAKLDSRVVWTEPMEVEPSGPAETPEGSG